MYFSITFGRDPDVRNTWKDWGMIPDTPPMIPPPEPNLNLVEIPGSNTTIDLSKYPTGKITYQRISGSWNFLIQPKGHQNRVQLYEAVRKWLHGRSTIIRLEEDPLHYYKGIFTVGVPATGNGPNQINVGYSLEPMRYNVADNTVDTSWVSDWAS